MKTANVLGLATLLPLIAYSWMSTATSGSTGPSPAMRASEYVFLHQTRHGASALQKVSDRSALQCVPE